MKRIASDDGLTAGSLPAILRIVETKTKAGLKTRRVAFPQPAQNGTSLFETKHFRALLGGKKRKETSSFQNGTSVKA
jgi:hypothetical protein